MSMTPSQRPGREWLWLVIALVIVAGVTVPLWERAHPDGAAAAELGRWTPERLGKLLLGPEQVACYVCFMWAALILWGRSSEIRRQRGAFRLDLLPTEPGSRILPEDARPLTRKVESATAGRPYVLARMIRLGLAKYAISRKAPDVGEVVRTEVDVESARMSTAMSTVSYLVWAIPAIGFLGTVRGLAGGMSKAGNQGDKDFIKQVTDQLGIAFDCTFVALSLSVVLMAIVSTVQKAEELLLIDCQSYCQEHLLLRLYEPEHETGGA